MVNESGGASGATIIIGSLNDQELKNSIDALVKHVEQGTQKMANSFDSSIDRMKNKLKELGSVKVNVDSGSDGGSTRRVRTQKAEVQAINETVEARKRQIQTLDQEAAAMQRAMTPRTAQESYYTIIKNMRENVALLAMEIKSMPSMSLDKQFSAYMQFERQIEQVKARIGELRQQLQEVGKDPSGSRLVARQLMDGIAEEQRKIVQLEREQIRVTNQIAEEDRKVLANKQAQYEKERQALIELSAGQREQVTFAKQVTQEKQQQAQATQMQSQAEREAAREAKERAQMAKEMAQMARESLRNGMTAWRVPNSRLDSSFIYAENDARAKGLSIEQQIDAVLKQEEADYQRIAQGVNQQLDGERQITQELSKRKKYQTPQALKDFEIQRGDIERIMRSKLGNSLQAVKWDEQTSSIKTLTAALKQYQNTYEAMTTIERKSPWGKQMVSDMEVLRRSIQSARMEMIRASDRDAVRLLPTRTIDEITYKMQQLSMYRSGLDVDKQRQEINQVNAEYDKLKRKLDELMQKNSQMERSNNALSRSWNYMKNRLAFYFTVGASTQFVRNLIDVRSQYEMNERALGILINSAERGTQIFEELSRMSLVSPYTLIELSAAAKQLVAYDIAANDVLDTTRRLADMAAAVGVPMERLTYALGQIKAYGYLNSRDNRMFANAGIPLVKQLSDYYTELEGKLVSNADVYDRIKKKAVDYNDVMQVIYKMTDEGGKFFDFQAKMADTLKVRLANLTLAWNNMLNDMGKETQGVLVGGIGMLRDLFANWKSIDKVVRNVAIAFGVLKAAQLEYYLYVRGTNKAIALESVLGTRLTKVLRSVGASLKTIITSPTTWWSLLAIGITSAAMSLYDARKALGEFNKAVRDGAADNYKNIENFLDQYKDMRKSLYKEENKDGKRIVTPQNIEKGEASKIWEAIREQIELTTNSSERYIGNLLMIENMSERARRGFVMLENIKEVNAALKEVGNTVFDVTQSYSAWWNLGLLPDGLFQNIRDYTNEINNANNSTTRFVTTSTSIAPTLNNQSKQISNVGYSLEVLQKDVDTLNESIIKFIDNKGWSANADKIGAVFDEISNKIALEGGLSPEEAFQFQLLIEKKRSEASKQALQTRLADERDALTVARDSEAKFEIQRRIATLSTELEEFDKFNGTSRVHWDEFTKWMSEQHKSEVTAMFGNMDEEQIRSLQSQTAVFNPWVEKMVSKYAKDHKMSYDEAFRYLRSWVYDANKWTIFIRTVISDENGKSIYDTLKEADENLAAANQKIDRLNQRKEELEKSGADQPWAKYTEDGREYASVVEEIASAEKDRAAAQAQGGHDQKQEKKDAAEARKQQKQAESELQKALKDELQLIDKVRSQYKKLTDAGVTSGDALTMVTNQFGNSISHINKILGKNGLPLFNIKTFAGTDDPNKILAMLKAQLDAAKLAKNIKPTEIKDLEVKYGEIVIDAKTYNTKKITDGLNNELSKIKDEYELAVELDANPEMGNLFADWMGIDMSTLPHTAEEYAKRMTKDLNKYLAKVKSGIEIGNILALTDDDLRMFQQRVDNQELNQVWVDTIVKNTKEARAALKKENSDIAKDWDNMAQKYAEYEYKIAQVQRNANKERKAFALKYGSNAQKERALVLTTEIDAEKNQAKKQELVNQLKQLLAKIAGDDDTKLKIKVAIDKKELEEGAKVSFEEFQKSPEWIIATGDLAGMTDKAIGGLITSLEKYKKKAKYLDPKQIKQLNKALIDLYKKQREGNPFKALSIAMMEAKQRVSVYEDELKDTQDELDELSKKQSESFSEDRAKKIDELIERIKDLKQKIKDGLKLDPKDIVEGIGAMIAVAKQASEVFTDMFDSLGVSKEITQQIEGVFTVLDKGIQGAQTGASIGGKYGAIIGGVIGVFTGLASVFGGGKDDITLAIERSERSVKQLEIAYKRLEVTIEEAYGAAKWGAEQAAIANKKLQLAELKRQLALERSRGSKDRDEGKINDLMGQIEDLKIEIEKSIKDITNDLLGISSVGNAAEELVSSMIDAFRKGEDYMLHYDQTFEDMINNMVMKSIVGRVIGDRLQSLWDRVDAVAKEKVEPYQKRIEELTAAKKANEDSIEALKNGPLGGLFGAITDKAYFDKYGITLTDKLKEANKKIEEELKRVQRQYSDAIAPTPEDVQSVRDDAANWRDSVKSEFEAYMELFGIKFGDSADSKQLSSLQQGIQSITEVTAQSLEAYANSISQQAYLRNDLLTQIRDTLVGFDLDVNVATLGQVLLQLQASYQTQQAIQGILEGWSSASGLAVKVEMVS